LDFWLLITLGKGRFNSSYLLWNFYDQLPISLFYKRELDSFAVETDERALKLSHHFLEMSFWGIFHFAKVIG